MKYPSTTTSTTLQPVPSNRHIRIAFLGCGKITQAHSKLLNKIGGVELYFASRSAEKAQAFQQKLNGKGAFDCYEKAIASPDIDVIFINTPPDIHLEWTLQAMNAGKHVIVEKPPFLKASDFDIIITLQQKTQTQVMVAENYFYKPNLQKLRQLLKENLIGTPKFLYFNATKKQVNDGWRTDQAKSGGGALYEGGIHWINFISNLGLKPKNVTGFQPDAIKSEMEDSMQVVMEYNNGAMGNLYYSWEIDALFKGLRISKIMGTEGSISFESNGVFIFVRGKKWKLIFPGFADIGGRKAMLKDFLNALRKGEEPAFNLQLAKRDLVFIEKAYETACRK